MLHRLLEIRAQVKHTVSQLSHNLRVVPFLGTIFATHVVLGVISQPVFFGIFCLRMIP